MNWPYALLCIGALLVGALTAAFDGSPLFLGAVGAIYTLVLMLRDDSTSPRSPGESTEDSLIEWIMNFLILVVVSIVGYGLAHWLRS